MSSIDLKLNTCKFVWRIENFKTHAHNVVQTKELNKLMAKSDSFSIKGQDKWHLEVKSCLCPIVATHEMSIVIELFRITNNTDKISAVSASITCALMKNNGQMYRYKCAAHRFMGAQDSVYCADTRRISRLIRDVGINNTNKHLTVICYVHLIEDSAGSPVEVIVPNTVSKNLSQDLAHLFKNQTFADVNFIVGDKEIKAHKAILMARSEVFQAMFSYDMKELKDNEVKIDDIDADVFEEMIKYIYTDYIFNLENIAMKLLYAADKYKLTDLKNKCADEIWDKINVESASNILILADRHDLRELLEKTRNFIWDNLLDVINTPGYVMMEEQYPKITILMYRFSALKAKDKKIKLTEENE